MTAKRIRFKSSEERLAYILLSPVAIYLLCIMLAPLLWAAFNSFTDKTIGVAGRFIGLRNYGELLRDREFRMTIANTLKYTVFGVAGTALIGMVMALVLNAKIKGRNVFRALMILPWTLPSMVAVLTWKWMYSDVGGVMNRILMDLGIATDYIPWLSSTSWAMPSVLIVAAWRSSPFIGISVLAGLQTIPDELYEAATVDGANFIQKFFHITLPGVKDVFMLSSLVITIWMMNDFINVWILTRGGPAFSTHLISTYSYFTGFAQMQIGKSISVSMIVLPVMLLLVGLVTRKVLKTD